MYFSIQTEENQETFVKEKLLSIYPSISVIIPKTKEIITLNKRKFIHIDKFMPEYIIISCESFLSLNTSIKKLNSVPGIIQVICETTNSGPTPAEIPEKEIKKFIKYSDYSEIFKSEINIIFGQYSGYTAKVNKLIDDYINVTVNISKKPKINIPIWHVAREL